MRHPFAPDRIATHILSFEATCEDYEKDKMRRLGADSLISHRLKYKKFSRERLRTGCPFFLRKQTFVIMNAMSALGQKRTFCDCLSHVRFTPDSRQTQAQLACPLCAKSRLMQRSKRST